MRTRTFVASAIGAALLAGGAAQARPDNNYRSKANGDWNTTGALGAWQYESSPGTWADAVSVPNVGDTVVVRNGHTITITGQHTVTSLTVDSGGFLHIDGTGSPYAELEFPAAASSPALVVNQALGVKLVDNARLKASQTMSFAGSGSIQAQAFGTCEIMAYDPNDVGTVLTLSLSNGVTGQVKFVGSNEAGASETLTNSSIITVSGGNVELAASLDTINGSGNYTIGQNLTLFVNRSVSSSGTFTMECNAVIDVNSTTFAYTTPSGLCSPAIPNSAINADFVCQCGS
jgi:hypothetical protein